MCPCPIDRVARVLSDSWFRCCSPALLFVYAQSPRTPPARFFVPLRLCLGVFRKGEGVGGPSYSSACAPTSPPLSSGFICSLLFWFVQSTVAKKKEKGSVLPPFLCCDCSWRELRQQESHVFRCFHLCVIFFVFLNEGRECLPGWTFSTHDTGLRQCACQSILR